MLASGLGLLRTSYGDPDVVSDFTPVDTSIKAMIVAAWRRAVESDVPELPVYNCSTSIQRKFTTGFIVEMGRKLSSEVPFDKMIWLPGGGITKCKYNNYIRVYEFQIPKRSNHLHVLFILISHLLIFIVYLVHSIPTVDIIFH